MFEGIEITWYGYVIAGFCFGAYMHSHRIRHWLHLLAIGVLRGFIWMLHKTDHYYRESRIEKSKPDKVLSIRGGRKDGIEVGDDELKKWLENPEVSVAEK